MLQNILVSRLGQLIIHAMVKTLPAIGGIPETLITVWPIGQTCSSDLTRRTNKYYGTTHIAAPAQMVGPTVWPELAPPNECLLMTDDSWG